MTKSGVSTAEQYGLKQGMSRAEYEAIDAVNGSTLVHVLDCPARCREYMLHPPEPTPAMELGTAIHAAVLEPDNFKQQFVKAPKVDRRTRAGKAEWAAFEAEHGHATILRGDDYGIVLDTMDAVWGHPTAAAMLRKMKMTETAVLWRDPELEIDCKGLIDGLTVYDGWTVVLDLKTARSSETERFMRQAAGLHYPMKASMYLDGLRTLADVPRRFVWIAVEKERPHLVNVVEPDSEAMEQGFRDYRRALRVYAECAAADQWPGYGDGINTGALPRWAVNWEAE